MQRPRISYFQSASFHRLMVSFWCCISFVGLGSAFLVFGPTLLDIANKLSASVGLVAGMYFLRAIGTVGGSVLSGVIVDKFRRYSYSIFCVILINAFATTFVLPLSVHIAMLAVFMLLNGVALGAVDNGTHAILLKLWGDNSGPCMQVLHFAFAFGAFIAPITARHFISEELEFNMNVTDYLENLTCHDFSMEAEGILNASGVNENCLFRVDQTCSDVDAMNETLHTIVSRCNGDSDFMVAFWISASMFVSPFLAFLYYAVRQESCFRKKCKDDSESKIQVKNDSEEQSESKPGPAVKQSKMYLLVIFILMFCFMFFYVGAESAFGSFVFTFAVKGELQFSKSNAAILAAVFWGTFAFTRLFSVVFALLKVKSAVLITCNILGSLIAVSILIFFPDNPTAVWIGSAVLGMSMAAIFPTTMTWMTENVPVSGKSSAVLIVGGNLGDITLPAIVGALIAEVNPISFIYFSFTAVLLSAVVGAVMLVMAGVQKGRSATLYLPNAKYSKLSSDVELADTGHPSIVEAANGNL